MKALTRTLRPTFAFATALVVGVFASQFYPARVDASAPAEQESRLDKARLSGRPAPDGASRRSGRTHVEPSPEVLEAVEAITRSAPDGDAAVTWSDRGVPQALYGKLGNFGETSEAAARQFLAGNGAAFRLRPDLIDLTLADERQSPGGTHLTFQQDYFGVKVYGGTLSVNFDRSGEVVVAGGDYYDAINLDSTTPDVTAEDARAALLARVGREAEAEPLLSELVVYVDVDGAAHLAYHIVQPTSDEGGAAETFEGIVDAVGGGLLDEPRDVNQYANGSGKVYAKGNAMAATGNTGLEDTSSVPTSAYVAVTLQGLTSNEGLIGNYADCYTNTQATYRAKPTFRTGSTYPYYLYTRSTTPSAGAKFDAVMAYYYVDFAQRYIQDLGFISANNRSVKFNVNGTTVDNSWYSPNGSGTGALTLGSGGVDDGEDAEVILHEYGHSIQDNQKPNVWGEPGVAGTLARTGGMGEGFGDYWACSMTAQHFQQAGTQFATSIMEWDASSYSSAVPPTIRSITSSKHYPEGVTGEVHDDGEIWSSTLWKIRGDIGAQAADKVILQSHLLMTSKNNTFRDGAEAVLAAARTLNYTQAQKDAIRNRFVQRGILDGEQLILNGGFELGSATDWAGWDQMLFFQCISSESAHQGSRKAGMLGTGTSSTQYLSQAPAFPAVGAGKMLSFYLKISSAEGTTTAHDFLYVRITNASNTTLTTLKTVTNKDKNTYSSYKPVLLPIPAQYAVAGNRLRFYATENSSLATTFYIDDVSIKTFVLTP
jgi:Zn-dependent metalloprotease